MCIEKKLNSENIQIHFKNCKFNETHTNEPSWFYMIETEYYKIYIEDWYVYNDVVSNVYHKKSDEKIAYIGGTMDDILDKIKEYINA